MAALLTLICVAAQLTAAALCSELAQNSVQWQQLQWGCVNESKAAMRAEATSKIDCVAAASAGAVSGDVVAQWNSDTGECCVFHYQQVCRLASAAAAAAPSASCSVFARFAELRRRLSRKFAAVWHFGVARDVNLACSPTDHVGNKNRLHVSGVSWSAEGVTFSGSNSSWMVTDDSDLSDFGRGLTWLLRLRRQPAEQTFSEAVRCSDKTSTIATIWEYYAKNKLMYNSLSGIAPYKKVYYHPPLPDNDTVWTNLGVSVSPGNATVRVFFGSSFLPESEIDSEIPGSKEADVTEPWCFSLGHSWLSPAYSLQGTVAALAVAPLPLEEAEIRSFFSQLPRP